MNQPLFIVSKEDWSLHRKGYQDQARHARKVKEAIKQNLPDLISEEQIILSHGRQIVKVPIRSLDEYHFRYNFGKGKHVGQGDGDSRPGEVVGIDPSKTGDKGQGAGDQAGDDYYEAEISVEELEAMLFEELELPNLQQKEKNRLIVPEIHFNDIRKKGIQPNIDKKRTLMENLRRNAAAGRPGIHHIYPEDLRYKTWEDVQEPHSNALILALMDTSGSMGLFEKYIARSFFFWMIRFIRSKYDQVEIVFLAHHTEAKEVSEEEFFHKGESGGTICSSAYQKAIEIIADRYPAAGYNIYPFHFSDGDNLTSDNDRCVQIIRQLLDLSNLFGYIEVNQYNRSSTLMSAYKHIDHPRFRKYIIREKSEILPALKRFFGKTEVG